MSKTVVLLNPHAAGGRANAIRAPLAEWLQRHVPAARLLAFDSAAEAVSSVRALPTRSRVVVVGGDGTVHHLLDAALTGRHTLGLVPFGSGNDTARAIGLAGMPWAPALANALERPASSIDLGVASTRIKRTLFLSSFCAGFDAAICARLVGGPRWLRGSARYLWGTLRELAALRRWDVEVTLDGRSAHAGATLFASTCNTPTFGSGMPAVPSARVDDGRLDLLIAGDFGRAAAARMLPRLMQGRHLGHPDVATARYAVLRMKTRDPMPLAADGEPLEASTHLEVRVLPKALLIVTGDAPPAMRLPPASVGSTAEGVAPHA